MEKVIIVYDDESLELVSGNTSSIKNYNLIKDNNNYLFFYSR